MDWLLEKMFRYPRRSAAIAAIIIVLGGSFIWWQFVWQNPECVFTDMLAGNLATTSVTKVATAGSGSQTVEQYARLSMGSTDAADWLVTAQQSGTSVTSESIGTPTTGYIRYVAIGTNQQKNGKPYDFSSVLNVWGKADGKTDPSLNQLFSQTLLDISSAPLPPVGNLPEADRQTLLAYMRSEKIFEPAYGSVKRQTVAGQAVYTYQVSVQLGAYVRLMQAFAHDLGLTSLDSIDPNQYSTAAPLMVTLSVGRMSHQLVQATYPATGFSQRYTDWGLLTPVQLPHQTIPTTQLQDRIQKLGDASV